MRYFTLINLFFGSLFILSSCSYKQDHLLLNRNSTDTTVQTTIANISNYRIKPQDMLQITNVQNNKTIVDLTAGTVGAPPASANSGEETYQVEEDGTIALTGLGRIKVSGLTRVEARKYIEDLYRKGPLKDPLLELKIISLKVTILGEINGPGSIPLTKDGMTLIEIIAKAGGLTNKADEKTIKIIRADQKYPKTDIIDLSNVSSLSDPRTIIQNNDIIVIAQNKTAVRNEKLQDFSIVVQPILLVFNTALIIFTLARK
jgi:polysaccharide export outer membrane protein